MLEGGTSMTMGLAFALALFVVAALVVIIRLVRQVRRLEQTPASKHLAMEAEQTSLRALEHTLADMSVGVWLRDEHGRAQYANQAYTRMLHITEHELLAQANYLDALAPEIRQQCLASDEACIRHGSVHRSTELFQSEDGDMHAYQVIKVPLYHGHHEFMGVFGLCVDMTEKYLEELDSDQQSILAQDDKQLDTITTLTNGVAHDFSNLLSIILGNSVLANKRLHEGSQEKIFISRIQHATETAANLCKQMMSYVGQGQFISKRMNLTQAVHDMKKLIATMSPKTLKMTYILDEDIADIGVEAAKIQPMMLNILHQVGLELSEHGGEITIRTGMQDASTYPQAVSPGLGASRYAFYEVVLPAIALDLNKLQHMFAAFGHQSFQTKTDGQGFIAKHDFGGWIEVQPLRPTSQQTEFHISFAELNTPANESSTVVLKEGDSSNKQPIKNLLLVDDDEIVLEVMDAMLSDVGYECYLAKDGMEAIEIFKNSHQHISVVVMDMAMPRMSGRICAIELQAINADVPIILVSGYSKDDLTPQFADIDIVGLVQKPFDLEKLDQMIKRILGH